MKKLLLFTALLFAFTSCSKDDSDTETNIENLTKYHATWLLTAKKDSNGNAVTISGCENGRNKMIINSDNTGSIVSGSTFLSSGGFICGEAITPYNYDIADSKIVFTNDANTYGVTYEVISVNSTTLVVKKISTNNNGTIGFIEGAITETYTKQIL